MKLDANTISQLNLNPDNNREPVNVLKVSELLDFLKESADRILLKSERYFSTSDADIQTDCLDIVAVRINDFVQAFIDIIIFIRKTEGTYNGRSNSLRYCLTSYDTLISDQTDDEKQFLDELLLRNEITHDYFNREIHQQKLIALMQNCPAGAIDVYEHLRLLCENMNIMDKYVDRNTKQ